MLKFEDLRVEWKISEMEVFEEGLDLGIFEGFGEQGVAEERAEFSIAGKVLEFGVVDDDGAGDGLAGAGVDDGLEG